MRVHPSEGQPAQPRLLVRGPPGEEPPVLVPVHDPGRQGEAEDHAVDGQRPRQEQRRVQVLRAQRYQDDHELRCLNAGVFPFVRKTTTVGGRDLFGGDRRENC